MGNIGSQDIVVKEHTYVIQELYAITTLVNQQVNMKLSNGRIHFQRHQQGRKSL